MKEINKKTLIEKINISAPIGQSILYQPDFLSWYEGYVIFCKYEEGEKEAFFYTLYILLEEIMPNITALQLKKVESLIEETTYSDHNYVRNYTMIVKYIELDKLLNLLKTF